MDISEDCYGGERLRLELALRLIRLEARTGTIRAWTGMPGTRIRRLYREHAFVEHHCARHRGCSPSQLLFFARSARHRLEAGLLASYAQMTGALALCAELARRGRPQSARDGLLFCQAYQLFQAQVPQSELSFERALCLLTALGRGDEVELGACGACGGAMIVDRLTLRARHCEPCRVQGSEAVVSAEAA